MPIIKKKKGQTSADISVYIQCVCALPLSVVCDGHTHRKQYRQLNTDSSSSESLESIFPTRLLTTNTHTRLSDTHTHKSRHTLCSYRGKAV